MRIGSVLWVVLVLLVSCTNKGEKVTREQCSKVADHIADLIIEDYKAHPDQAWDSLTAASSETGLPSTVTKETFKAYLDSPEGQTWLLKIHGQTRSATEAGIDKCVEHGTPTLVACLLAAKSHDDVIACDKAK